MLQVLILHIDVVDTSGSWCGTTGCLGDCYSFLVYILQFAGVKIADCWWEFCRLLVWILKVFGVDTIGCRLLVRILQFAGVVIKGG